MIEKEFHNISSVLKVGKVIGVEGRTVRVEVDKDKNASHLLYKGSTIQNISVGGYIKIIKGYEVIYGKIEGEYIKEIFSKSTEYENTQSKVNRILNIKLLGFLKEGRFERGIKELPLIANEVYLIITKELQNIHDFISDDDQPIQFGTLALEKNQKIQFGINKLFASHIGIFGNTGSGKSYTLAKIYNSLFEKYQSQAKFHANSKFFLIDFNGEYVDAENADNDNVIVKKQFKQSYILNTKTESGVKFPLPKEALEDINIWRIIFEATEKTQTPFLRRSLTSNLIGDAVQNNDVIIRYIRELILSVTLNPEINQDRNVINNLLSDLIDSAGSISEGLIDAVNFFRINLKYHTAPNNTYYFNPAIYADGQRDQFVQLIDEILDEIVININDADIFQLIHIKIILNYYTEIIRGYSNKDHIAPLIKRIKMRVSDLSKTIEFVEDDFPNYNSLNVLSLRNVNIAMKKVIPLLVCKFLFENHKEREDESKYLNIIIDEAHNILSTSSERESQQWKDYRLETFEEIIKEGRKFGVFMTIASQRPFDISSTIISQLHNYVLHRLINNNDIQAIERTVSYLDKVSFETLSILPTGTCIIAGNLAPIPVIVDIDQIESIHKPFNKTIEPIRFWLD